MPLLQAHAPSIVPSLPICEAPSLVSTRYAFRRLRHPYLFSSASRSYDPLRLRKLCVPKIRIAKRLAGIDQGTAHRISEVILRAWTMINAVLAASRCLALKRHKLSAQSVVVE